MSMTAEAELKTPPDLDIDPFAAEFREDPTKLQALIRETAAVVRIPLYDTYAVGRHADVETVLKDYEHFSNTGGPGLDDLRTSTTAGERPTTIMVDPPEHTPIRAILTRILSPRVVRGWREAFELEGRAMVTELVGKGRFEVVSELSEAFVVKVFTGALGVKMTQRQAHILGNFVFNTMGPRNDLVIQSEAEMKPLEDWMARSRTREGLVPGGFGAQVFDAEDAGEIPPGLASGIMLGLLRGGMDTTIAGIGTSISLLAQHKGEWAKVRANPALVKGVFEETLRFESSIQSQFRTTIKDVELAGYALKRDKKIQVFYGAANRDPRKWEDPDTFDISRSTIGHLTFGAGIHNCIGQMIARLEAEAVLRPFVELVSDVELEAAPVWRPNNSLRTLQSLPIRVTRA